MKVLSVVVVVSVFTNLYGSTSEDNPLRKYVRSDQELVQEIKDLIGDRLSKEQLQQVAQQLPLFRKKVQEGPLLIDLRGGFLVMGGENVMRSTTFFEIADFQPEKSNKEGIFARIWAKQEQKNLFLSRIMRLGVGLLVKGEDKESRDCKDSTSTNAQSEQPVNAAETLAHAARPSSAEGVQDFEALAKTLLSNLGKTDSGADSDESE